ncbi:carboxylesterase/lipase family protein [Flavihumibacter stibioxidans]|uniref:Carboxylic ester hydrolase n=1 Tax=Flavihumibacter stibioxidans TaxID=1834163 RepID=A0ABR7MBH5_9BACT|nr:carboxylesterase family protein [Flavihumibacter stibioxidans]MBC6492085.1 carboxylesterase [Flavihumibacter stibioxidans]
MKLLRLLLILILATNAGLMAQPVKGFPVRATIKNGILEGVYDIKSDLQVFLGIPFAQPPVGPLRWKAPQPAKNWTGIREAKKFGPGPVQGIVFGDMGARTESMSEDCLYLNVWSPSRNNKKNLPVLVYFYGGGFVAGDGSEPRYDGASMAKKGIVVLTVNYRLNIFGFFSHPELSREAPYRASGNYGLLDQHAALKWVRENIAAFGGDPNRVTIAGESAGSISVSAQMASPLSKGLIHGAIGESGAAIHPTLAPVPLVQAEKTGVEFMEKAGIRSLAEMRNMSTAEIFQVYQDSKRFGFPTVIDGYFYPKTLPEIFTAREQSQVPLLLGWNSAEIPGMAFMQGQPYKEENYINRVKAEYPKDFEEVLKLYPHGSEKEIEWSATNLASDRFIAYSTWKWFDLHRKHSNQKVYRYLYSKLRPLMVDQSLTPGLAGGTNRNAQPGTKMPEPLGAPHACEIEYCMGNLALIKDYAWTEDDHKVSATMLQYFANFIITGNPNGNGLPEWPAAEPKSTDPPVMILDTESKAIRAKHDARYEFLNRAYGNN